MHTIRSAGSTVTATTLGETVRAFVPCALPPTDPALAEQACAAGVRNADLALARLPGVAGLVPSLDWLLYSAIRKEALLMSQIEGTQATLMDLFDDEAGLGVSNGDDVEEVSNYLRAYKLVRENLHSPGGLPISVRLLCDAHRLLLDGVRGASKQPGELRQSQNWIGGTRSGNAVFVPAPPDRVPALLADLERYIHGDTPALPPLVRVALVHVQFETIHPFLDGNGRIGPLLIAALLEHWGLLPQPLMYLSGHSKQHQQQCDQHLSAVRTAGDWEAWVGFFLEGVAVATTQAERGIVAVASLVAADRKRVLAAPRVGAISLRLFELLPMMPRFTIEQVRQKLDTTFPTATAAVKLRNGRVPGLLAANRHIHRLLVGGVPAQCQKDGETLGDFVRLVDWVQPGRNEWLAVNQFSIQGAKHTRRPDIILFVNGLPLLLLELKNPADVNADVWKAWAQIQTYNEQIADVFQYNEVLVISDRSDALLGSLSADPERFMAWRTIDGVTLDPLDKFNELQTLVRGVLAPKFLLDYLRYFVLFEDDDTLVKKIAGYHQFHAVRAAIAQVVAASRPGGLPSARGKGGVVWHTQGSGKSITMTCFAARVMQEPLMENPTIAIITDRNDLDGQLFGVFSLSQGLLREQPVQVGTRHALRALLANRPSGGIVFATIQKFMPGEDEDAYPLLSDRRNIVVIADEAHRTQYGFEAKLKTPKQRPPTSVGHTRGFRRLHQRLRHAAGAGRRHHRGHLLRKPAGPPGPEGRRTGGHRRRGGRAR